MSEDNLLLKSSTWVLGAAWFNRILGFLSVFLLARLLTPADFGAFAVLLLVIQATSVFTDIGVDQYYVQKLTVSKEELCACWTLNFGIKTSLTILLVCLAPFVVTLLEREDLLFPLITLSFLPLVNAANNGFIIHLKRELSFHHFARFAVFGQIAGSVISITIAYLYTNYWALVIGMLSNALAQCCMSYVFLNERTTFTFKHFRKPLHFGKWLLLRNGVAHIRAKFDIWFAASFFSLSNVGGYNTLKDIAMLPSRELVGPLFQVFFSFMSMGNRQDKGFDRIYATCFIMLLLCTPMSIGLFLLSKDITMLLLGEQWVAYSPILATLAILTLSATTGDFVSDALLSRGLVRHVFLYDLITLFVALISLSFTYQLLTSPDSLAKFRALFSVFMFLSSLAWLSVVVKMSAKRLIRMFCIIFICGIVMSFFIFMAYSTFNDLIVRILFTSIVGATTYFISIFLATFFPLFSPEDRNLLNQVAFSIKNKMNSKAL